MNIHIKGDGHDFHIPVPSGLIFSKASAWLWLKMARKTADQYIPDRVSRKADAVFANLSDEAVYALCKELMRIKRKHGRWKLLEVESSDGEQVLITL